MDMKTCYKCRENKPLSSFCAISRNRDRSIKYYYAYCRKCASSIAKIRYAKSVGKDIKNIGVRRPNIVNGKKYCNFCKQYKIVNDFYKNGYAYSGLESNCKYCTWVRQKIGRRIRKMEFLVAYGGKCICCGESNIELLTIEHIRNKGHKLIYESSIQLIVKLKKLKWPEGYTILCYNCNMSTKDNIPCVHNIKEYEKYITNLENTIKDKDTVSRTLYFLLKKKLSLVGD